MKESTVNRMKGARSFVSRVFIDRRRKAESAIEQEKRALVKEFNGNVVPAYLYDYYVSICQIPYWDLTDDAKVAKQIGLTERVVSDNRRALIKNGWVRFHTHVNKGVKYALWYFGKDVVEAFDKSEGPTGVDLKAVGVIVDEDKAYNAEMKELANE